MNNALSVSPHIMVSDDEEDELDPSSYDDSFIDDRINPTAASTQADATTRTDMMAIYRFFIISTLLPSTFHVCVIVWYFCVFSFANSAYYPQMNA